MLTPIINVGYESKQLYDNIFEDSTDGGQLTSHSNFGGDQTRAIELVKNEDDNGFEYKSKTPLLVHRLSSRSQYSKPPFLLTMLPYVVILSLSLNLKLDIHFDGGCVH